jgi:hypothetical protein
MYFMSTGLMRQVAVSRKQLRRGQVLKFFGSLPRCLVMLRIRDLLIRQCTQTINALRGHLA